MHLLPLDVHVNSTFLANILSLSEVEICYQVTMDTTVKSEFNVLLNDHTIVKFLKCRPGMYYFDTTKSVKSPFNAYSFFSTVKDNKSYFIRHEIEIADRVRDLQGKIGWTSVQDYRSILTNNQIINTKVTGDDINRAESIYGPRVAISKGKMVRKYHNMFKTCHASHCPVCY